uniref:Galectin n=1 Tax=Steinernema glaseri TaxID=37863 RepID=A0A1I7YTJ6_9BILA
MYGDHHHHHSHHHKDDAFGQPFNRDGQDSAPYPDDGFGPVPHHPQHSIGGGVTMQHGSDSPYQPQLGGDSNYQPPTDEYGGEGRPPFPVVSQLLPGASPNNGEFHALLLMPIPLESSRHMSFQRAIQH